MGNGREVGGRGNVGRGVGNEEEAGGKRGKERVRNEQEIGDRGQRGRGERAMNER